MHGIGMSILILLYVVLVMVMVMGGGLAIGGGGDTLSKGETLTGSQTLTSKNGFFELGFFPPNPSISNGNKFYLSIRYIEFQDQKTIVWVANREKPLTGKTGSRLEIPSSGGNLQLYDGGGGPESIWSPSSPESVGAAVLEDDGNLKLRDDRHGRVVWQSFDDPTDTWLPGAKLGEWRRLVSWTSEDDPSPGIFSAEVSESNDSRIVLKWKGEEGYGEVELDNNKDKDWIASKLSSLSFSHDKKGVRRLENSTASLINGNGGGAFSMVVLEHREGILTAVTSWRGGGQGAPERLPLTKTLCGANGVRYMTMSSSSSSKLCGCLPGYRPLSKSLMGWSCSRKNPMDCVKKDEIFKGVPVLKLPGGGIPVQYASSEEEGCGAQCLNKCECKAYAAFNRTHCLTWENDLVGTQQQQQQEEDISSSNPRNPLLYLRLAKGETKMMEVIIAVVAPVLVIAFGAFLGFFYNSYRMAKHKHKEMEVGEDLLSFDFNSSNEETISRTRSNTNTNTNIEFDLPMFTYASVSAATNNFSPENKLGEGGFGPVYKGCLLNGQEIALKRLSQKSGQGFEEFRNEMLLIAKLQHRNLVRLLGCCIHPNESILIYEYLPNKSLDLFLFGSKKLDWMTRTRIIEGVAQGLLYLHEYSRVRIIHRDLKASNILLDDEMNPKISDFGMARIFAGNDSQTHTNKIVGTYGYIAPEYAMEGLFSIKSDVYSFGVLVLEIISGRKNTGFYKTDSLNLLGHAWDLWISGRGEELVDDKAGGSSSRALRYINVGLLCVQENPNERPNMSSVVSMLGSEIEALPQPKKPAFSASTLMTTSSSSVTKTDGDGGGDLCPSINGITVSDVLPR